VRPPAFCTDETQVTEGHESPDDLLIDHALRLMGNPALGLDFGHSLHLSHLGVLGLNTARRAALPETHSSAVQANGSSFVEKVSIRTLRIQDSRLNCRRPMHSLAHLVSRMGESKNRGLGRTALCRD
jgi:hypothetical protein